MMMDLQTFWKCLKVEVASENTCTPIKEVARGALKTFRNLKKSRGSSRTPIKEVARGAS